MLLYITLPMKNTKLEYFPVVYWAWFPATSAEDCAGNNH